MKKKFVSAVLLVAILFALFSTLTLSAADNEAQQPVCPFTYTPQPVGLTPLETFITNMFNAFFERGPNEGDMAAWLAFFEHPETTAISAIRLFLQSQQFIARGLNNRETLEVIVAAMFGQSYVDYPGFVDAHNLTMELWGSWVVVKGFAESPQFNNFVDAAGITVGTFNLVEWAYDSTNFILYITNLFDRLIGRPIAPAELIAWTQLWHPQYTMSANWLVENAIFESWEFQWRMKAWTDEEFVIAMLHGALYWIPEKPATMPEYDVLNHTIAAHIEFVEERGRMAIFESLFGTDAWRYSIIPVFRFAPPPPVECAA